MDVQNCPWPSYVEHVSDAKIRQIVRQLLNVFLWFDSFIKEVDMMKAEVTEPEHACFM